MSGRPTADIVADLRDVADVYANIVAREAADRLAELSDEIERLQALCDDYGVPS